MTDVSVTPRAVTITYPFLEPFSAATSLEASGHAATRGSRALVGSLTDKALRRTYAHRGYGGNRGHKLMEIYDITIQLTGQAIVTVKAYNSDDAIRKAKEEVDESDVASWELIVINVEEGYEENLPWFRNLLRWGGSAE
jgi:hypothetical protein